MSLKMKSTWLTLVLPFGSANAANHLRRASSGCCFHLSSVGILNETVTEDHTGNLILAGAFQQGGFCIDETTKTIKDSGGNNCFMRSPKYEFECYTGVVGATAFDIVPSGANGTSKLVYDNGPGTFLACPQTSLGGQSYEIFSTSKTDTTGCLQVALVLANQTAQCSASNHTIPTASSIAARDTQAVLGTGSQTPTLGMQTPIQTASQATESTTAAPAAPLTCSVSASAPSIAPFKLGYAEATAQDGIHDTSSNASITPTNSTIFQYSIPQSFITSSNQLCALQFRMPFCSSLPTGYPCFSFSGSEQESLSNSGMIFTSIDDDEDMTWDNTKLHQVYPGNNVVLGIFECGSAVSSYGGERQLSWIASSVRNFGLEFMQAGIGPGAQFSDGVGAWIVPCS
jgi:hypothetical protein